VAGVVPGARQHPAQPAQGEISPWYGQGARPDHARACQQHQRAEYMKGPAEMLDERAADGDEAAAENKRAQNPEVQDPPLQPGRHLQRGEQHHEREDVVHAEGLLQQVTGEILTGGARALP
jgi:hypothetical protein